MSDSNTRSLREELEIRVIALLTGELSEADADELEKILQNDEALSGFRDRMATLMGDVHQARDEIAPTAGQAPLRLSDERRREIFGDEFEVEEIPEEASKKWWHMGLLEIAAMFIFGGVLIALLMPTVGALRKSASPSGISVSEAAFEEPRAESAKGGRFVEHKRQDLTDADEGFADSNALGASGGFKKDSVPAERLEFGEANFQAGSDQIESDYSVDFASDALVGRMAKTESAPVERLEFGEANFQAGSDQIESDYSVDFASDALVGRMAKTESAPVDAFAASAPPAPKPSQRARRQVSSTSISSSNSVDPFAAPASGAVRAVRESESYGLRGDVYDLDDTRADAVNVGSDMLALVDRAWERPRGLESRGQVMESPMASYSDKMKQIVIPQVNFSGMPLSKVVKTLQELSVEYDPEGRGVQINYIPPADGNDPRVNISLRNLNLDRILQFVTQQANFSYDRGQDAVIVQSGGHSPVEQAAIARNKLTLQTPKAEKMTRESPVSTFSLNVSDVSFKLAQAALDSQRIPDPALIRTEEFVNSFSYGDPAPRENEPVTLNWEIAQHPFAHDRQVVRFSLQTQAAGRAANQPLNLNLLIDNSGSMQRPDRRAILEQSLQSLQAKLTDQDRLNIVLFARQPTLIANASSVSEQRAAIARALDYQPQGGTNLESGLQVAYQAADASYDPAASNRVILMTDGAANLGDVDSSNLAQLVVEQRKRGIALDAYGVGWEDYNDALLEEITRNGDGRYAFLNSAETAAADFAEKLAGTLRVAAADVKVQIIWNPERVKTYRQIGYDLHQLRAQDFRDNTVDAAEIGEAESGTALYVLQINDDPELTGALGELQVRYRVPATGEYVERAWPLEMPRQVPALTEAPASLRLAAVNAFFAERLANNPYAANYNFDELEALTRGLPEAFPTQSRVRELQTMIHTANSLLSRFE